MQPSKLTMSMCTAVDDSSTGACIRSGLLQGMSPHHEQPMTSMLDQSNAVVGQMYMAHTL